MFLGLSVLLLSLYSYGQMSASASVPIVLRIPGTITLSLSSVPVSVNVANGSQRTFSVPLSLSWNLNPAEVQGFRVVAYYQDAGAALTDVATSAALPAAALRTRWGQGAYLPFASDATATLFQTSVLPTVRRGEKQDVLELKIDDALVPLLPDGSYQGTLYLEVRHY
jgi:hypothetical protein